MTLPPPSTTTTPLLPSSSPAPTPAPPRSPPPLVPSPLPAASPAGLSLFLALLDAHDQSMLVSWAESVLDRARRGKLAPKAYTAPPEAWQERGKGREAVHFGLALVKCNKVLNARVEPIPPELERLFDSLERANIFAPTERPDCVVVNYYAKGCWLPAHVDSEAFERPFCTVSLVSEAQVAFGLVDNDGENDVDNDGERAEVAEVGRDDAEMGPEIAEIGPEIAGMGPEIRVAKVAYHAEHNDSNRSRVSQVGVPEDGRGALARSDGDRASANGPFASGDDLAGSYSDACARFREIVRVSMPPGSVIRLDGDAAGPCWLHALPPHPQRRISITCRRLGRNAREAHAEIREAAARALQERIERRRRKKAEKRTGKARGQAAPGDNPGDNPAAAACREPEFDHDE
uniref:Fe2OG dioxygenase domain-containing protein n=1 Tax=Chrysotila carterae TaxID=13221 RepID=A0A7S4C6Y6_CHRCT